MSWLYEAIGAASAERFYVALGVLFLVVSLTEQVAVARRWRS